MKGGMDFNIKLSEYGNGCGDIQRMKDRIPGVMRDALKKEAYALKTTIQKGIRSQAPGGKRFTPLAPSTIKVKGSSKALIDQGDLIRSVNVTKATGDAIFVGVHRNARNSKGDELYNIAEIHEFGTDPYEIPVTPKLWWWWEAMATVGFFDYSLPYNCKVIHHPGVSERPFLRPSFDQWSKHVEERFGKTVRNRLQVPVRKGKKSKMKGSS